MAGFSLPLPWDLPLIGLALFGMLAIVASPSASTSGWSPLALAVVAFLAETAVSTILSEDIGRSVRLSTPLIPGVLLFFLVSEHFTSTRDTRLLYITVSIVGLGLASGLMWLAWRHGGTFINTANIGHLGIPILVVRNDVTFLALIAPLSLVLLLHDPRGMVRVLAALSICLSLGVICFLRSRTAVLTMLIALICTSALLQRQHRLRRGLICLLTGVGFILFLDGVLGFPLMAKFGQMNTVEWRITQSLAAWEMFLTAPVFGHGPHTYGLSHKVPWVHNLYVEVLAEQGILGLTALGGLLICGFLSTWKHQRMVSWDAHILGAGAVGGLIGFCSAAVVELSFLREWVIITLFMLLGVIGHLSALRSHQGRKPYDS